MIPLNKKLSAVSIFLALISTSFAQELTNVAALARFSAQKTAERKIEKANVQRLGRLLCIPIRQVDRLGVKELIRFVGSTPVYRRTLNVEAAQTISADALWPGGSLGLNLNGNGLNLGIWDDGIVRTTHQEYTDRVTLGDTENMRSSHPTAVGGTMIAAGINAAAKGMSFAGNLISYGWDNDTAEMATAAASGLLVSNHSYGDWGALWQFGFYDTTSQDWDQLCYDAPFHTIFTAAGNSQGSNTGKGAYDSLILPAAAKNVVSVGAVNSIAGGYQGDPTSIHLASFSSCGPTDDGRVKPDICGCGVGVFTLTNASDSSYASWSGTSFSTPNVTGASMLLIQHFMSLHNGSKMRSATLKDLLIHTAVDAGRPGPDYQYGWGLVDCKTAAQVITRGSIDPSTIQERTLSSGTTYTYTVASDGTTPLKATVCWTDPAGTPTTAGTIDSPDLMLVNDLDLRITRNGTTYMPWILDPPNPTANATTGDNFRDNVEQILVANPTPGIYTITISHKGALLKPSGTQAFSLLITGNAPRLQTVSVQPSPVVAGKSTTGTVLLDLPAPAGGMVVTLGSSDPTIALPDATVTVPENATQADFNITTIKRTTTGHVNILATLDDETASAPLTVNPTPQVSGTVTLQDWTLGPTGVPVTVELRTPGSTTPLESYNVTLGSDGSFSLLTTLGGTYDVAIKASHWLRKTLKNVSISDSGVNGLTATLINGDANGDNSINLGDLNRVSAAWRSMLGSVTWNVNADLNGDGQVNLGDWNIVSKNWRKNGDP